MVSFDDHVAYTDPPIRPILRELRTRITALDRSGRRIREQPTAQHRVAYKLANDGQDHRAVQHYLGHKNIQHTVRYTELSPDRFKSFWED